MALDAAERTRFEAFGARLQDVIAHLVGKPWFWVALLSVPFGWPIWLAVRAPTIPSLPVLGQVANFELNDQEGRAVNLAALSGKAWAANFLSSADDPEDQIAGDGMGEIQYRSRNLGQEFAQVTFVLGPSGTKEALQAYAQRHHVSPRSWHLLSQSPAALEQIGGQALAQQQGGPLSEADNKKLAHGALVILVDQRGGIRGTYEGSLVQGRDNLLHDIALLVNRGR